MSKKTLYFGISLLLAVGGAVAQAGLLPATEQHKSKLAQGVKNTADKKQVYLDEARATEKASSESNPTPTINFHFEKIGRGECENVWGELWPKAKQGDVEARAGLFGMVSSYYMTLPDSFKDAVSRRSDLLFLSIHSAGYQDAEWYQPTVSELYRLANLSSLTGGEEFLNCLKSEKSLDCSEIAVNTGLVSSFEERAQRIDASQKSACTSN